MKYVLFVLLFFCMTSIVTAAANSDEDSSMPWDAPLEKIRDALTGNTAMIISVIAMAGSGFLIMTGGGGGAKRQMGWIVLGIAIAMNAPRVITILFPEGMIL